MFHPDAKIISHRVLLPFDTQRVDYEWQGGRFAWISGALLPDIVSTPTIGTTFRLGQYRLRIVDYLIAQDAYVVSKALLPYASYRLWRLMDDTYRRMILTLTVWGLAELHQGEMPQWRWVKLFNERRG